MMAEPVPIGPPLQDPLQAPPRRMSAGGGDPFWASVVLLMNGINSLADATGRHTMTSNGAVATGPNGVVFNGGYIQAANNLADFSPAGSFTWDMQVNGVVAGAATAVLMGTYADGAAGQWELYSRGNPNYNSGFYSSAGQALEPAGPVITDAPVELAVCYDAGAGTVAIYLGGARIGIVTGPPNNYTPAALVPLFIGIEGTVSKPFKGTMRLRMTNANRGYGAGYVPTPWPKPTS